MTYNPNQYDDVMARLTSTKPVTDRDPFVAAGEHDLVVVAIETFNDQKWGKSVRGIFEVEASTSHPIGARVVRTWNLFKPSAFPTQPTDADQFAQFVCILQGLPEGSHAPACQALLKSRAEGGNSEAQPARGARVHASGQQPKAGNNPQTGKPYSYVKVTWRSIPQDGAMIAAARAALDAKSPYIASPQYAAPQGPPPGVPMQYAQAPQAPAPMQYAPAPVQYAQPAPQPIAAPPAGGFLAMMPNNGQG